MGFRGQGKVLEVASSSLADVVKARSLHSAFIVQEGLLLSLIDPYICPGDGRAGGGSCCPYFTEEETEALCLGSPRFRIRKHPRS